MRRYVLDANALYRYLTGGPGAELVSRLLKEARDTSQPLRMSVVNWGEVYYNLARARGFAETDRLMERVRLLPVAIVGADEAVTTRAARLKAGHGLHYADCFAAALVEADDVLVTSDSKDFRKIRELQVLALPSHRA